MVINSRSLAIALSVTFLANNAFAQSTCNGRADLWFLNDESGSVDNAEWTQSKSFIQNVAAEFAFSPTAFQGGLIAWADSANIVEVSGLTVNFPSIAASYTRQFSGGTDPADALAFVASPTRLGTGRTNVPSVVVLLTDASSTQLTGDSANFIAAADTIRARTGSEVVVMLIEAAAAAYTTDAPNVRATIDAVAGSAANVVVGASYADIADPARTYISDLASKTCTVAATAALALPGVTFVSAGQDLAISEAGDTGSIPVVLNAQPSGDVEISITDPTGQCSFSPTNLTFTAANFSTAQPISVSAVDDSAIEGTHSCVPIVSVTSSDANYNGFDAVEPTMSIADNDSVSLASTILTPNPASVIADGTTTSTITVQLKDANGNDLTSSGGTVVLTTDFGTLGTVTDNADGTYTATLLSSIVGSATVTGTLNGTAFTDDAQVVFTPLDSTAPLISGPSGAAGATTSAITVNENQTAVTQFTANEAVAAWSLSGADAAKFAIANDGTLTFLAAPDFENPTDLGDTANNNTYLVIVTATDGANNAATQTLIVTVANVDDTPADAFATHAPAIRQIVTDAADRSLRSTVSANRNMVQGARNRLIAVVGGQAACSRDDRTDEEGRADRAFELFCQDDITAREDIPLDINGVFNLSGPALRTSGEVFGQNVNADGTSRRLLLGDFDIQFDGNTGSNTATLTARIAWERMVSETTMLGYFIGADFADSDIAGDFVGDHDRLALSLGGYAVHRLGDRVYLDGFLTYGVGRNQLGMANDVLSLRSSYDTRTATLGAAVTGVYAASDYEFQPELSFSYGRTWVGGVSFTGSAYGLVDDTLSMNVGSVSLANLLFRPELIWGLDADTVAESQSHLRFAPRLICAQTIMIRTTEACGGGAELGLGTQSDDGLTEAAFSIVMDRVGRQERTRYSINFDHRF